MGNSSSGHQQVTLVDGPGPPNSWAHSFPRTSSFKVLPDRVPNRKLRHTNNGAILHNGGTISGRKVYAVEPRDKRHQQQQDERSDYRKAMYGSEPDLRYDSRKYHQQHRSSNGLGPPSMNSNGQCCYSSSNDSSAKARIGRTRKKYKAPPVPTANNNHFGSSSPDSYQHWETSGDSSETTAAAANPSSAIIGAAAMPARRSRLFKTRAETKRPSVENNVAMSASEQIPTQLPAAVGYKGGMPGHLQRSLSSPQFQDELTAKLRQRGVREPPVGRAADSPHSSPTLKCKENVQYAKRTVLKSNYEADKPAPSSSNRLLCNGRLPPKAGALNGKLNQHQNEDYHKRRPSNNRPVRESPNMNGLNKVGNSNKVQHRPTKLADRLDPADRAKSAKTNQPNHESKERVSAPVKTFYFGMEEDISSKPKQKSEQVIDKFAANFRKPNLSSTSPSDSYSSGPATTDETSHGISLKLRPTLPRKQFDIPRFSPTAAWRLLSALESPVHSEEDDLVLIEEQIPHPNAAHQLYDKSGDSGISGDASPHREDSGHNSQVAWTPQQDLEETSSDGGLEMAPVSPESVSTAKFSPRFSLSLPREEHLTVYSYSDKMPSAPSTSFQNLKKLKRSVSGALGKNKDVAVSSLDENWLLSRSVPNLYNSYRNRWSDTSPSFADQDDEAMMSSLTKPASFSYLASGGHVMYLPEYQSSKYQQNRERHKSNGNNRCRPSPISKSCEDLSNHRKSLKNSNNVTSASNSKQPKKFTFQSTIRQIERKRIADKLSKDAEQKERQRLRELEAMRKVEEEFQRKREREKADIRQQLRLYNLAEGIGNSNRREQPDGMVYPTPPPSTQILSEYREPRREYKDFTTATRADSDSVSHTDISAKKETVHPEVVYHMPKSAHVYVTPKIQNSNNAAVSNGGIESVASTPRSSSSDNYRKNFAQGILPRSLASSDSELSQSNIKPTAKLRHKKNSFNDFENDDSVNNASRANVNQIFNSIDTVEYLSSTYKRNDNGLYSLQLFENSNNDEKEVSDCAIVPQYQPSTLPFTTKAKSIQYLQPFTREDKQYKPIHFKQILTP